MTTSIGRIRSLHRHPVKSMLGESVTSTEISDRGLFGDRTHALFDTTTGKIASAKKPSVWRDLLQCSARREDGSDRFEIRFPDGNVVASDDPQLDQRLSTFLKRPVHLISQLPEVAEIERAEPDEVLARGVTSEVSARVIQVAGRRERRSPISAPCI